jgi:hypothetical protein
MQELFEEPKSTFCGAVTCVGNAVTEQIFLEGKKAAPLIQELPF